jgi:hypothetical protein
VNGNRSAETIVPAHPEDATLPVFDDFFPTDVVIGNRLLTWDRGFYGDLSGLALFDRQLLPNELHHLSMLMVGDAPTAGIIRCHIMCDLIAVSGVKRWLRKRARACVSVVRKARADSAHPISGKW